MNELRELQRRLARLPCRKRNRCVNSSDPHSLGTELKLRLAMRAPVYREVSRASNAVHVQSLRPMFRHVPIYDINSEQDHELLCEVKVKTI
ncbi:uncharacterized protein LOC144618459 [Crassostrea virginica]